MDTAIQRDFAGGRFTFFLTVPSILAIERGPVNPAHRVREYPVSLFEIYDELSAGVGINQVTQKPTLLPGLRVFYGDLHHILERALVDGASGDKDGETFKVDSQLAAPGR